MSNAHPGRILPQDVVPEDGSGDTLTALPFSQSEIEELLYGDDRPTQERIERLQEVAAAMRDQQPGDFGGGDTKSLLGEIEEAIARLNGGLDREFDPESDEPSMDGDPLNHRETLSPDSDELQAIEQDDEDSLSEDDEPLGDDALDPEEWDDGYGSNVDRGVK